MKYLGYLSTPTKEKFDKTVEEILNRLEYKHLSRKYIDIMEGIKEKILSWIKAWLNSIDISDKQITDAAPSISNGIIIIGSVLIILIVIILIIYIKRIIKRDKRVTSILGEIIDEKTTTQGLYEKARRYKELKDYREALRYSFIALLFQMNENNLLYLDETQTNTEIIYTLKKNDFKDTALFQDAVNLFNKVWYGHKKINEDIYESWEKMIAVLNDGVSNIENKK